MQQWQVLERWLRTNLTALAILPKTLVMQMGGTDLMSIAAGCQVCLTSGLLSTLPELLLPDLFSSPSLPALRLQQLIRLEGSV